jgi:glycosyltransferase involved in cell wall biosynthesis
MKILLSAYTCGPWPTSEPSNAWRAVNHALAQGHEVWTITEKEGYDEPTMKYLAEHPMPGFHPTFVQLSSPLRTLFKHPKSVAAIYYHLWQHHLLKVAKELHEKVGFDVAHHVTFGRYWSPSGLRELNIPFIWGPVGAAESTPPAFLAELPWRARLFEFTRDTVRSMAHFDPALRATARAATIGIGVSREACDALRDLGVRRVEQLPQAALLDDELAVFDRFPPPPDGPFRAICMGRLLHWKGFYLAIRAFAIFARKHPEAELWIVNDGPFREELEATAVREGVQSQVHFTGLLPKFSQVMDKLAQCHVLMHPALHEAFGNVCMEAMAAGRPVVCLDVGGPASQVTPETGFIAPATTPKEAVEAMAAFLTRIAENRGLLLEMSVKARARVREKFSMRKLGGAFISLYEQAIAMHACGNR